MELKGISEIKFKKGDRIIYPVPQGRKYTIIASHSGWTKPQVFTTDGMNEMMFRFVKWNEKDIGYFVGEPVFQILFEGISGVHYVNKELDEIGKRLFGREEFNIKAKSVWKADTMGFTGVLNSIGTSYWTPERRFYIEGTLPFRISYMEDGKLKSHELYNTNEEIKYGIHAMRAKLMIEHQNQRIKVLADEYHNGKSNTSAYQFVLV